MNVVREQSKTLVYITDTGTIQFLSINSTAAITAPVFLRQAVEEFFQRLFYFDWVDVIIWKRKRLEIYPADYKGSLMPA